MPIETVFPLSRKGDVKDLVFTILTKEHPLKIIELTNYIRKRYGKSVTFQGVRKALIHLVEGGVLVKEGIAFSINKEWVRETKNAIDELYLEIFEGKAVAKHETLGEEVSVFTFDSLNHMMKFWQDLIEDWFRKLKPGDYAVNAYQCSHAWEGILHLDREQALMGQLKKKGIKSYILSIGNSALDRNIRKFYKSLGITFHISPSSSSFDKSYYVGTYGGLIIQARYPAEIVKELDEFFRKNNTLEDLDLRKLSEIANRKIEIALTVIKNLSMAKQINTSILSQME